MDKYKEKNLLELFREQHIEDLTNAEAILEREVTPTGNSGHIVVGKEFIGHSAKVVIRKKGLEPVNRIELRNKK